jgi:hypothetical protein
MLTHNIQYNSDKMDIKSSAFLEETFECKNRKLIVIRAFMC